MKSSISIDDLIKGKHNEKRQIAYKIIESPSTIYIEPIVSILPSIDDKTLQIMLLALGSINSREVIPHILQYFSHENESVRNYAISALFPEFESEAADILIKYFEDSKNLLEQITALTALYRVHKTDYPTVIGFLDGVIHKALCEQIAEAATNSLAEIIHLDARNVMIKLINSSNNYEVRRLSAYGLSKYSDQITADSLFEAVKKDNDNEVKQQALLSLKHVGSENILGKLASLKAENGDLSDEIGATIDAINDRIK